MNDTEITSLRSFLLDIDCLANLSKWLGGFNFFEIAKISRAEIRHSNILAWLMDPMENHGMGDKFLQGICQELYENQPNNTIAMKLMLFDYYSFSIKREWERIDIFAVSEKEKCVICIENKIDAKESKGTTTQKGQLERYKQKIEDTYPNYQQYYIFLTPDGEEASSPDVWMTMTYETILNIIERSKNKSTLTTEARILIDNYIDLLRRRIVKDSELVKICNEIYAKHRAALDLIFENKSDLISETCMEWAKTSPRNLEKGNNTVISFTTVEMNKIFPKQQASGAWNDNASYYFQIRKYPERIRLSFVLDLTNSESDNLNKYLGASKKPKGKKYWSASTRSIAYDEDNFIQEEFIASLDKSWSEIQKEIKKVLDSANI
ncbi:MAG: PD-(D/E)XK nuclease family protein [Clostridia bacterium]|nr:PD-(D/E)XK nuclease family protein [Clostridia bacterium]